MFKANGVVDHELTLAIQRKDRLPELVSSEEGRKKVVAAISASLTASLGNLNTRLSMSSEQVLDLAEEIIDSSFEDHLALEDVLLFLKDLIQGKCGVINDRMDMPTFFKFFEVYRQERHEVFIRKKEEQHANNKVMGRGEEKRMDKTMDAKTFMDLYNDMLNGAEEV